MSRVSSDVLEYVVNELLQPEGHLFDQGRIPEDRNPGI